MLAPVDCDVSNVDIIIPRVTTMKTMKWDIPKAAIEKIFQIIYLIRD